MILYDGMSNTDGVCICQDFRRRRFDRGLVSGLIDFCWIEKGIGEAKEDYPVGGVLCNDLVSTAAAEEREQ